MLFYTYLICSFTQTIKYKTLGLEKKHILLFINSCITLLLEGFLVNPPDFISYQLSLFDISTQGILVITLILL